MRKKSPKKHWARIWGVLGSVLIYAGIIVLLLNTIGFAHREKPPETHFEFVESSQLILDDIVPIELPPLNDDIITPERMDQDDLANPVPPENLSVEVDAYEDPLILDNLSALKIKGIGADLQSRGALRKRYGERAIRNGLLGSYFNRIDFTGKTYSRIDETLNYFWELNSPWEGKIQPERFSVIWTGRIVPPRTGLYTFYLESDDGARLWIEDELVLDQFVERERETDVVQIHMLVGKSYDIKYAFCDVFQHAVSKLEWSCEVAGIARELVPTKYMWADGKYTRQLIAWNKKAGRDGSHQYANREKMRNPAMIEGKPFSHIVGFQSLGEESLTRLGLSDLSAEFNKYVKTGRAPVSAMLPDVPPDIQKMRAMPPPENDDVTITIL